MAYYPARDNGGLPPLPPTPTTPDPSMETEPAGPLASILLAVVAVAIIMGLIFGATAWATAGRAGTVIHYVCQPGDTAVVRDGFGQRTPQCVTADGSTVYWPDRVRVPR